jgi:3-hydroxy-9,10-secoandrosta-1,3,5(10)-triene-9,17-dione monooxygenase reductase component
MAPMDLKSVPQTPDGFRSVMSLWTTGIAVITAAAPEDGQHPLAIVSNSFTSLSAKEELVMWAVDFASSSHDQWVKAQEWVIHFLADDQKALAERFAKRGGDKYQGLEFQRTESGTPLLEGVVARLYCSTERLVEIADHTIVIGKVGKMERSERTPLHFFQSKIIAGFTKD